MIGFGETLSMAAPMTVKENRLHHKADTLVTGVLRSMSLSKCTAGRKHCDTDKIHFCMIMSEDKSVVTI